MKLRPNCAENRDSGSGMIGSQFANFLATQFTLWPSIGAVSPRPVFPIRLQAANVVQKGVGLGNQALALDLRQRERALAAFVNRSQILDPLRMFFDVARYERPPLGLG